MTIAVIETPLDLAHATEIAVVGAFYRARQVDADRSRPFRVPGGNGAALGITAVCIFLLAMTTLLFMYIPGSGFDWPVVIGSVSCVLMGEVAMRFAEYENRQDKASA